MGRTRDTESEVPEPPALSVLAVDDYQPNLVVLGALLEQLGYDVVTVASGVRAAELCSERGFALILLDVRMPGMSGEETAALIRQSARNQGTPIVFLTGDDAVAESLSGAGHDVLTKPYTALELQAKVESAIAEGTARKQRAG